ncbi:MAG: OadG family protein [Lachnospiraceae bacterium]|nr:OadG family protein [Lachnospiraceae bacterium]
MKKKFRLLLCMILCIIAITGCGKKEETPIISKEEAQEVAASVIEIVEVIASGEVEFYPYLDVMSYEVQLKAVDSYNRALKDMGEMGEVSSYEVDLAADETIITAQVSGTKKDAEIEIIIELTPPNGIVITSYAVNVEYTFGEKMTNAALNTLLGMFTVFSVLILLIALISCFNLIPKLTAMFKKKDEKEAAIDNTIAQIVEKEEAAEELVDDLELVAVIAAAIAASEGATSTDGFVVRSIRKTNAKKWQNA